MGTLGQRLSIPLLCRKLRRTRPQYAWTSRRKRTSWRRCWIWQCKSVECECCPACVGCRCPWTVCAIGTGCSPSALASAGKLSRPYRGQLRQLGAQSEYSGRHDPRVRTVETMKEEPTKQQKYKYESREDALAAKRKRSNRAHRERRRRAVERLMAANEEIQSPTMRKRGGQKTWKNPVRRRYNRDLRRQKQRRQRRQAVNRQIWQRL